MRWRYGLGYWPWDYPWRPEPPTDRDYFVFVESGGLALEPKLLLGPDDEVITDGLPEGRFRRFRMSGIQVRPFLDLMNRVEPLDHDRVEDVQRRLRGAQLREELEKVPLPLLDLYVGEKDEELPFLAAMLTPGAWFALGVRRRAEQDDRLPLHVGAPELPHGPYRPGALEFIEAVPPYIEYRLRDIFSLVHVPDAGFEGPAGEPGPPPPDAPDGRMKWDFGDRDRGAGLRPLDMS